jgi:hypothetical protein
MLKLNTTRFQDNHVLGLLPWFPPSKIFYILLEQRKYVVVSFVNINGAKRDSKPNENKEMVATFQFLPIMESC